MTSLCQQNENHPNIFSKAKITITNQSRQFGQDLSNHPKNFFQTTEQNKSTFQKEPKFQKSQNQFDKKSLPLTQNTFLAEKEPTLFSDQNTISMCSFTSESNYDMRMQEEEACSNTIGFETELDIFKKKLQKPELVHCYVFEIFDYLKSKECYYCPNPNYFMSQQEITPSMRAILIDWLVDVHIRFKLVQETLFLSINLLDRYLSIRGIAKKKLQLVGVAAMFIACKYEEIYAPELVDFVYVCDKAYSKEEILEMESKILSQLQFNLSHTSSFRFLERQCLGANLSEKVNIASQMLLELALIDHRCLRFTPSLLSTTAILISLNLLDSPLVLPTSLHFDQTPEDVRQCIQELLCILQDFHQNPLSAVKRKYNTQQTFFISEIICVIIRDKSIRNS